MVEYIKSSQLAKERNKNRKRLINIVDKEIKELTLKKFPLRNFRIRVQYPLDCVPDMSVSIYLMEKKIHHMQLGSIECNYKNIPMAIDIGKCTKYVGRKGDEAILEFMKKIAGKFEKTYGQEVSVVI